MATVRFRGDAPAVAQVNTVTPASVTSGNTFTCTINSKAITVTATAATVANVTGLMTTAINASDIAEFEEITATDSTTHVTLTANTAGKPFTQTSSSADGSGSAGHSFVTATTTSSSGPNHWGTAANWSGGAVPVNSDDVYIENTDVDLLYDMNQSSVTLTSLNIAASYTGRIGLPDYDEEGDYYEYKTKPLTIMSTTVNVGYGDGSGSSRIRLSLGNNTTTLNVNGTGSPSDSAIPSLTVAGHASATYTVNITQGSVGFANNVSEVCVLGTVRLGNEGNTTGDVSVLFGSGCTITTIEMSGGAAQSYAGVTTLNMVDGDWHHYSGAITTGNIDGGTLTYESTSTITTLRVGTGATVDFSRDIRSRTVTTTTINPDATIKDPYRTVTWTNGIVLTRCTLDEVTLDLGTNITVSFSTPGAAANGTYAALYGDGAATSYSWTQATHGLAPSNKLMVASYLVGSPDQLATPNIYVNNSNGTVTVTHSVAPSANAYRIVIMGATS